MAKIIEIFIKYFFIFIKFFWKTTFIIFIMNILLGKYFLFTLYHIRGAFEFIPIVSDFTFIKTFIFVFIIMIIIKKIF